MSPLEQLNGQTLWAISEVHGTQLFTFSACVLVAYTPVSSSESLASLVGLKVTAIDYAKSEAITISLGPRALFSISLKPEHYVGPEAFCAQFKEIIVVG